MKYLITVVVFIVVFSILILIHELGHFIMAKRAGIKVEEFGFGLPPRIWGKKKGDTIYSINWIPFGGFVRMLGEDSSDPGMLRRKKSFISQSLRTRVKVVVAGVLMNFLLAWVLLSIGFTVGMQPLLSPDDVLSAVDEGIIELEEGVKIKEVVEGSIAEETGFKEEDVIFSVDGKAVDTYISEKLSDDSVGVYKVIRDGNVLTYEVIEEYLEGRDETEDFGIIPYEYVPFPRVKIFNVDKRSETYEAGLRDGDIIISVNGKQVFTVPDFEEIVRGVNDLEYEIFRDGYREKFIVEHEQSRRVIISSIIPGFPADESGLLAGDVIVSVNGNRIDDSEELIAYVEQHAEENIAYLIERNGERLFFEVTPEDGKIGVYLSELMSYGGDQQMSLYNIDLLSSVIKINELQYPWYVSAYKSFGEGVRLSKLTGAMFIDFVGSVLSDGEVPETVAGPVGIAQLTYVFVQEGLIPVIRFVAILSLSLAVINILPFPALDGGRLLFMLVEFIVGRRINQKWESFVHALGFILIIALILVVTYSDIIRWINS